MEDEKTVELKHKVAELKQRLNQMYAQYFSDTSQGRVFENEFSLYLKACENAKKEILDNLRFQHDVTKIGLIVLIVAAALTVYLFTLHVIFGVLILAGAGFFACGFMYLLLAEEIKIMRASGFCNELEEYFQRYRWKTELKTSLNLPEIPLWGEYIRKWEQESPCLKTLEKRTLFVPFRISIALVNLLGLAYIILSFISPEPRFTPAVLILCIMLWIASVVMQMLIVNTIIYASEIRPGLPGREELPRPKTGIITRSPGTWINILRLFLILDVVFPEASINKR